MPMRWIRYTLVTLSLAGFGLTAQSQNADQELLKLYREKSELQEQLNNKDRQITELADSVILLKERITILEAEKHIAVRKANNKADSISKVRVEEQNNELNEQIIAKNREIDRLAADNIVLKEELSNLNKFKQEYLTMLAEKVDSDWVYRRFSEIDIPALDRNIENYEQYAAEDSRIASALEKLKQLRTNADIYDKGMKVLASPFDAAAVKEVQIELNRVSNNITDPVQKEEIDELGDKIFDYPGAVRAFKDIIADIDDAKAGMDSHNAAFGMIEAMFNEDPKLTRKLQQINNIPWLAQQYEIYYAALKKDALAPNKVRDTILSL